MSAIAGTTRATRRRPVILIWLTLAVVGWTAIAILAAGALSTNPPTAAFDLELLLEAGRAAAAGQPLYDPAILGGHAPDAVRLFFSYPPPVGQALAITSPLPTGLVFALWSTAAVGLLALAVARLARALDTRVSAGTAATAAIGLGAVTFPFVIAILFGNLDAFFPGLYGLALAGALSGRLADRVGGGIGLAAAAIAKLYPAGLGLWFLLRGLAGPTGERRGALQLVGAAAVTVLAILFVSVLVGGVGPWLDYAKVAGVLAGSDLVDGRNVGPAARLAVLLGGGNELARTLQIPIAAAALVATALAAWRVRDGATSLAIAAAASLLLLPIAWIHYPAAMIPFAAAALLRSRDRTTAALVAGALVGGVVALVILPVMWLGVLCVVLAVATSSSAAPEPAAGEPPA